MSKVSPIGAEHVDFSNIVKLLVDTQLNCVVFDVFGLLTIIAGYFFEENIFAIVAISLYSLSIFTSIVYRIIFHRKRKAKSDNVLEIALLTIKILYSIGYVVFIVFLYIAPLNKDICCVLYTTSATFGTVSCFYQIVPAILGIILKATRT